MSLWMTFCDSDKSMRVCSEVGITYMQFKNMGIYRRCLSFRASIFKMQALPFFWFPKCALLPWGLFEKFPPCLFSPGLCLLTATHSMGSSSDLIFCNPWSSISPDYAEDVSYWTALYSLLLKEDILLHYSRTSSQQRHCFLYTLNTYILNE